MPPNLQETVDLVTSTEEIHSGKLHFCAENKKRCRYEHGLPSQQLHVHI